MNSTLVEGEDIESTNDTHTVNMVVLMIYLQSIRSSIERKEKLMLTAGNG